MGRLILTAAAIALAFGAATQEAPTYQVSNDRYFGKRKEPWQSNGKRKKPKVR